MHPELARLLHHACRRPDDPVAGLVLADWLEEHGDEKHRERARFLRIHNQLQQMRPYQPERTALARQAADIRAGHEADWVAGLTDAVEARDFHRGLVTLVLSESSCDDGRLSALADCPELAWVCAVHCRGWKAKPVKALGEWRGLGQVGHVEISGAGVNARALKSLQQSGQLAGLWSLDLGGNSLGDGGARALAEWDGHECPGRLELLQNGIGPAGAKALAGSAALAGLRVLKLDNNVVGDEGVRALVHSEHLAALEALHLHDNEITAAGARELSGASGLSGLRVLGLGYNTLMPEGVEAVARAAVSGQVEELMLRSTNAGNSGVAALVNAPLARLKHLDLSHNGVGPAGAHALSLAGWLGGLETLRLGGNVFGAEGARLLARRPGGWALRALDVRSTGLRTDGLEALLDGGVFAGLEELNLGNNGLDAAGARALAGCAWPGDPPWLDLRHNPFAEEVKALLRDCFAGRVAV